MPYTLNAGQETKELRTETMHIFGRMITRAFKINKPEIDNVKPARGDLLVGWSGDATGLARPRVTSYQYGDNRGGSKDHLVISAIEPIPYSTETANVMELSGSQTPIDSNSDYSDMKTIHVSSTADHASVPTEGDLYPGDTAISGRYCVQTQIDKDTVPGLFFVTAVWRQYNPVAGGSATAVVMELAASQSPLDGNAMFTEMKTSYLATDPDGVGLPQEGDLYDGDTAIIGRYCIGKQESKHGLTGLYFVNAVWRQYRLMTEAEGGENNADSGVTVPAWGNKAWYEVLGRSYGVTDTTRAIGSQSIICSNTDAVYVVNTLNLKEYPDVSNLKARRPIAELSAHGMVGVALVRLAYDSTTRYYVRKNGYARIMTTSSHQSEINLLDKQGEQKEGPIDDLGNFKYRVIGTDVFSYRMDVVISAAASYNGFNHNDYLDLQGTVNDATLTNIGNAAAGTMLLNKVHTQYQYGDDLVYIDYYMTYNPDGWNTYAKSQVGSYQLIKMIAADGKTGYARTRVFGESIDVLGATTPTTAELLEQYEAKSFSTLNGYTYWPQS